MIATRILAVANPYFHWNVVVLGLPGHDPNAKPLAHRYAQVPCSRAKLVLYSNYTATMLDLMWRTSVLFQRHSKTSTKRKNVHLIEACLESTKLSTYKRPISNENANILWLFFCS